MSYHRPISSAGERRMFRTAVSKRRFLGFAAALAAGLALAGPGSAMAQTGPLKVVATTGMIADAARQIGGSLVEVKALMGPGVDPHAYRQTRTDIVAMTQADLVLWHGLYLEAQMEDFMRDLARKRKVAAVAEALPKNLLVAHDDYADKDRKSTRLNSSHANISY